MVTIAIITIIIYSISTFDSIRKYGIFSLPSGFLLSLGFFQVSRLIFIILPGLQDYVDDDYSLQSILLSISVIFFKIVYDFSFKFFQIQSNNKIDLEENKGLFTLGKFIILITFIPALLIALQAILSPNIGYYGVDESGPSTYQKIPLYAALVGLQFLNSAAPRISRESIFFISLVALPRLLLSFVNMRGYFVFFIATQLSIIFSIARISTAVLRKTLIIIGILIPIFIVVPLYIRGGGLLTGNLDTLSLLYVISDPIKVISMAIENIDKIPNINYSLGPLIAIYLPFIAPEDFYLPANEGILINRLDRALSQYLLWDRGFPYLGTGGNYIADLYIDFGFIGVAIGSGFIGFITALFMSRIKHDRLFLFNALFFVHKLLYLPRGCFVELIDMLPIYHKC
ncbi:MAG: O-antigen polysaccharide polymerase Wzy family protein [Goleter apudmare HA4340-LM2]|jgi:oligosaccharide repeat unit polymerase|nr:O-antigen polysaccharide polymerase Wzy family protein [Goleter apudmare HA4340-LM2]